MYVYICVYVYVHVCIYIYVHSIYIYIYICTHMNMCAYTYVIWPIEYMIHTNSECPDQWAPKIKLYIYPYSAGWRDHRMPYL